MGIDEYRSGVGKEGRKKNDEIIHSMGELIVRGGMGGVNIQRGR